MKKFIAIFIILIIVAGATGWYFMKGGKKKDRQFTTDTVTKGNITNTISASGSLAALNTVEVGSQVSGQVLKIYADYNDTVKAGQLIAELDPASFKAQVLQHTANLESARASLYGVEAQIRNLNVSVISQKADIKSSKANVTKAAAVLKEAEKTYNRNKELFQRKLISASDLDSAETAYNSQKASYEMAVASSEVSEARLQSIYAQLDSAESDKKGAQARVAQNEAQLELAKIDLDRTKIYSPIDGVIIDRAVDEGQTVQASFSAPKLFVIAQDLRKMQIDTAVDETDIGVVKEGQSVTFTVDAYKTQTFKGTVHQVRLSPNESSSVVTYSVMVNVDNPDLLLKPGMTANSEILVGEKKDVLRLPIKAMYFKVPDDMKGMQKKLMENVTNATDTLPVWVKNGNEKPTVKTVKMGYSNQDYIEIPNGELKEGDVVITGISGQVSNSSGKNNGRGGPPPRF